MRDRLDWIVGVYQPRQRVGTDLHVTAAKGIEPVTRAGVSPAKAERQRCRTDALEERGKVKRASIVAADKERNSFRVIGIGPDFEIGSEGRR